MWGKGRGLRLSRAAWRRLKPGQTASLLERHDRAALGLQAGVDRDEQGRLYVWMEVPWRAKPMKRLYGGRVAWQAEYGETVKWEKKLGECYWLLPYEVRSRRLDATGPRAVTITRSYRSLPLDPTENLPSIAKPIMDALVRLRWLVDDKREALVGGTATVLQERASRPFTRVRFGPIEDGGGECHVR